MRKPTYFPIIFESRQKDFYLYIKTMFLLIKKVELKTSLLIKSGSSRKRFIASLYKRVGVSSVAFAPTIKDGDGYIFLRSQALSLLVVSYDV